MASCALLLLALTFFDVFEAKESETWLVGLHQELKKGIVAASIEFGDFPLKRDTVICEIKIQDNLKTLGSYLEKAELRSHKGHVLPELEFEIHLEFLGGGEEKLLGWVLDGHPNDIFLERTIWEEKEAGKYSRRGSHSIKISNAASWIKEIQQECIKTKGS